MDAGGVQFPDMLSRDHLLLLFQQNHALLSKPEIKRRIRSEVLQGQDAADVTTAIQEELLEAMGIDPPYGISCLSRVSTLYQNDRELMTKFFEFVAKEQLACDEADMSLEAFEAKEFHRQFMAKQQKKILDSLRELPALEQAEYLREVQYKVQEEMTRGKSGAAMTSDEVLRFFQMESQLLPPSKGFGNKVLP